MGKKGKTKGRSISNVKKSNIKQNKLIKAGKAKPKSNPHFVEGGKYRNKTKQGALTPEQLLKRQEYEDEKKKNVSFLKKITSRGKRIENWLILISGKRNVFAIGWNDGSGGFGVLETQRCSWQSI